MRANIAKEFQLVMHPSTYFLVLLSMLGIALSSRAFASYDA